MIIFLIYEYCYLFQMDIFPSDITQIINNYDYAINYELLAKINRHINLIYNMMCRYDSGLKNDNLTWYKLYFIKEARNSFWDSFASNVLENSCTVVPDELRGRNEKLLRN